MEKRKIVKNYITCIILSLFLPQRSQRITQSSLSKSVFAFLTVKKIIILLFFIVLFLQCAEQKDDPICECVKKEIVEKERIITIIELYLF